jgi:succinoglycan biosynthesis transport protein ExoP
MTTPPGPFATPSTLLRSLAVIALATCGSLAGAYVITSQLSPTYQARSSVAVTYADDARPTGSTGLRAANGEADESPAFDLSMVQAMVPTIAHMAESRNVAMAAARSAHVPPEQVIGRADADYEPGDTIITLTASASTASGASAMADAVADVVHEQVSDGRMVLGRRGVLAAQPLDRASSPEAPTTPNLPVNLALSGTLGLLIGIAVVALGAQANTRLRTSVQIEAELGLTVLGTIPRARRTRGGVRKAFRRRRVAASVRATIAALSPYADLPCRRLLVTSPTESDAKTFVAALLGMGFAEQEFQTTLIDTDFGRPRLATHFPGDVGEDLRRLLVTDAQPPARRRDALRLVSAEAIPRSVGRRLLSSLPFRTFVEEAVPPCDVVVLNGPPVLVGGDLSALAEHADAAILVVTTGSTRSSDARLAVQILRQLGVPVAGAVVANSRGTGRTGWPAVAGRHESTSPATTAQHVRPDPLAEPEGADAADAAYATKEWWRSQAGSSTRW